MALYVISYDLHGNRNYAPITGALQQAGAKKLLESVWLLEVNQMAASLRDALKSYIDDDDSLAIIELFQGAQWATTRARKDGTDWLRAHIS